MELLERLGYRACSDCYRHPNRQAVFCGDLIDRGPQIRDTVGIVRSMVEHESALIVMGNHEFNAIAFHTEHPDESGIYFRRHTERNVHLHQATLDQLSPGELRDAIDWFRQLPIAVDVGSLRVVHACWDAGDIGVLNDHLSVGCRFDASFLNLATDLSHPAGIAVERVLKGPEVVLPREKSVTDKDGNIRRRVRIRWFESPEGHSLGSYSFPAAECLTDTTVPPLAEASPYPKDAPPVFIGHYWLDPGTPQPLASNVACLDYSVARQGQLCGYRFDGESVLAADRFVVVPARDNSQVCKA